MKALKKILPFLLPLVFAVPVMAILYLNGNPFIAGSAILSIYFAVSVALYFWPRFFLPEIPLLGKVSLFVGLMGNYLALLSCAHYLVMPRGTVTRDMGWVVFVMGIAFSTLIVGLPTALMSFRRSGKRVGLAGVILSLSVLPVAAIWSNLLGAACGIVFEQ